MKNVTEAVLTALANENLETLISRLSLCDLPLENLVTGIPVSVSIIDEELVKELIQNDIKIYPQRRFDNNKISAKIYNDRDRILVRVYYEYFYKRNENSPEESIGETYITMKQNDYEGKGLKIEIV